MKKYNFILLIIVCIIIFVYYAFQTKAFGTGDGQIYSYGDSSLIDVELNSQGTLLYASSYSSNAILEIDTNTMEEIRRFSVEWPTFIKLSNDDAYIYTIKYDAPCKFIKIRISDGVSVDITLDGEAEDFTISPDFSRAWVLHRTWPLMGTNYTDPNDDAPPASGLLTEVNLSSFTVSQTQTIESMPCSVWYSEDADRVFVYHELSDQEIEHVQEGNGRSYRELVGQQEIITIYDVSIPGTIRVEPEELRGGGHNYVWLSAHLSNWDDDGNYMAIPSPVNGMPAVSMRVANTETLESFNLTFPDANGNPMGCQYFIKVPGQNVIWAVINYGKDVPGLTATHKMVVRVETNPPYNHEVFVVNEAQEKFGDFTVSPDGNTLFLTLWRNGEVIEWSPD
jgi:hypothetical protein